MFSNSCNSELIKLEGLKINLLFKNLKMWKDSATLRFDDWPEKSNMDILQCILCTLRMSAVHINQHQ